MYELIYFTANKAYSVFYLKLRTALEDRDYINTHFLARECWISGVRSKYRIKVLLEQEAA